MTGPEEGQWLLGGSRDEASFYMAETQMLTRENEMLKKRIRELERQVLDLKKPGGNETAVVGSPISSSEAAKWDVSRGSNGDKITSTPAQTPSEGAA